MRMKFEDAFIVGTINSSDNISDKKSKIKKLVKANIDKNELLKEFLEVNRIKGEFIKEATNAALRNDVRGYRDGTLADKILDTHRPICSSIVWKYTSKGIDYWSDIDDKFNRFRDKHQ